MDTMAAPHDCISKSDFSPEGLPWIDRQGFEIQRYVQSLGLSQDDAVLLKRRLHHWMTYGYVVLEGAIEPELIEAYFKDMEELLTQHERFQILANSDKYGVVPIRQVAREHIEDLRHDRGNMHMRLNDFYNYSVAAKKLSLHPSIVDFVQHLFRDSIVVLQSLSFFNGSEQELHQDFAFVPAKVPSQLAATWIALEDIHPDSGPLLYIPGSHVLPRFDWGDGIFRTPRSTRTEAQFHAFLREHAAQAGLTEQEFCPKKGDVFVWHGALAHGGTPVRDRNRTRKAYVTHYSAASTHLHDYRESDQPAKRVQLNGGYLNLNPHDPANEDVFRNGANL